MGQGEVLKWLEERRKQGNDDYLTYREIHVKMQQDGLSYSYVSIWVSITCLFDAGDIEAMPKGTILSRTWVFRAKKKDVVQVSYMKEVYNKDREVVKKSGRTNTKRQEING